MNTVHEVNNSVMYHLGEYHGFAAAGVEFMYLVPSGAVFAAEGIAKDIVELLQQGDQAPETIIQHLLNRGYSSHSIELALDELAAVEVIGMGSHNNVAPASVPVGEFPLQRLVLNVTNQCNLACTYCYEYSDDKIAQSSGKQKYMSREVAESAVDMLIRESSARPAIHVTFFGGETLLNFSVMKHTVEYAKVKAAEARKATEFSLTTNATLLNDEVIDFLSEHSIGVTVSIDGDRELNDQQRVFHNGKGSYDVIVPKIQRLLKRHRTNSIGARVTLTAGVSDVRRIYRHLTEEIGFDAVGFSPATASPSRLYSIGPRKMDNVLDQFTELAFEYRDFAVEGRQHGFTNASDTLKELHNGISKAYACGAGLGLLGVGTEGDLGLCHRFVDSPFGKMGHLNAGGIDRDARRQFLDTHHVGARYDCHTCWARPVCAGGCYHEAFIHHGNTSAANLHYCDWIRGWNDVCLRVYGEIAIRNAEFLDRFSEN
jgi:uncharacterized protein